MWLDEPTAGWVFLGVSCVGAAFTLNAFTPTKKNRVFFMPSFFASWLTAELALQHIAWQALATLVFVAWGALAELPGKVGLGITICSWIGLVALFRTARAARPVFADALEELPASSDPAGFPGGQVALPILYGRRGIRVVRKITFREVAGKRLKLDVVMPEAAGANRPALLQVHGGGWILGNKREQGRPLMGHLATKGWVCFNVDYRLSPAATWPDHLEDVKYAVKWIRDNADEFGVDPTFIACTGGSAGGHLTAMMGLTANDPEYQPGFEDADTRVQAAIPVYGIYDFTNRLGTHHPEMRKTLLERWVMKKPFNDAVRDYERASPLDRIDGNAPPFLIVHGDHDTLAPVEDARMFQERLRATSKAPVFYAELPGAQHAFDIFASSRTAIHVDAVLRFLEAAYERSQSRSSSGL